MPFVRFVPTQCAAPQKRAQADFGFNPFYEILSAVESELLNPPQAKQQTKRRKTVIKPHFDIRATKDAFYLEGELPGVSDKDSLDIQFTDESTLVVKGEISRRELVREDKGKEVERSASPTPSERSLNATVEDVDEATGETTKKIEAAPTNVEEDEKKSNQPKFWLSERSIGVFERKFEFQDLVDPEGVTATLEHGILEIVVPRRQPVVKKVQIM